MTQQIPDTCTYDDRRWEIIDWDGDTLCIPTSDQLGFKTVMESTANYGGRVDHFLVAAGRLFLFKIQVNVAEADKGKPPDGARREAVVRYEQMVDGEGNPSEFREWRQEFFIYDDLVVPFTGDLLLRRPYIDDWDLPASIYDPKREDEEFEARLRFRGGELIYSDQREIEGRRSGRRELGTDTIAEAVAESACKRISRSVISLLRGWKLKPSVDGSQLETVWEKICAQEQSEESYDQSTTTSTYLEPIEGAIRGAFGDLPDHVKEAIWLQTPAGDEWRCEALADRDPDPPFDDDIVDYIMDNYILAEAFRYSNSRIRAYLKIRY